MIPAKNRERKCSTCKHYQPSPLWRKGWCRNPLLYDRNTNHLVEADSLACNRTFIDYWEPLDGPAQTMRAASGQGNKPRIAPSVPLEQVDKKGNRMTVTGNTPAMGMSSVPPKQVITLAPKPRQSPLASLSHDDLLDDDEAAIQDSRATLQMDELQGPEQPSKQTAKQRVQPGRPPQPRRAGGPVPVWSRPLPFVGAPLWMGLALLAVLLAVGGGFFLLRPKGTTLRATPGIASVTAAKPSPTGYGEPTSTVPPKPTVPPTSAPPAAAPSAIAPGVYVQVNSASGLSVRDAPTTKGKKLMVLANGAKARVTGPSKSADGFTWWPIDQFDPANPQRAGWSAEQFLAPTTSP